MLSGHTLTLDAASGAFAVLDVRGFPLRRQWYVIYPSTKQLSPVARAFLHYITEEGASRNQSPGR